MRKLALIVFAAGCASKPPAPVVTPATVSVVDAGVTGATTPSEAAIAAPSRAAARWFPRGFVELGDGRKGAVSLGRRLVLEGTKTTVESGAPFAQLGRPQKVPESLGGGWLFIGMRSLAYAKTFEGALTPIGDEPLDGPSPGFAPGLVLASGKTYELATGKVVPPVVPDPAQMFGLPTGQVAVRTNKGDIHLSRAKGKPFTKVASGINYLAYDGKGYVLQSSKGQERLTLEGKVEPMAPARGMISADNVAAFEAWPDFSAPPKSTDIDRMIAPLTIAMADGAVLLVAGSDLLVFDARRGELASTQKDVFANQGLCFPLRGGTPAFIGCNRPGGMTLFRVDAIDRPPVAEKEIPQIHNLDFGFTSPAGGLAHMYRCDGSHGETTLCVRQDEQSWAEIEVADPRKLLTPQTFIMSVATTKAGTPYGFAWQEGTSDLLVLDGQSRTVRVIAKASFPEGARSAIRWPSVTVEGGTIRFLLPGGHPGILTVDATGHVDTRELSGTMAAVGARAMLIAPDGGLSQTVDAGKTWHAVDTPPGGADPSWLQCYEGGCAVGPWNRLGWGG